MLKIIGKVIMIVMIIRKIINNNDSITRLIMIITFII